MTLGLESSRIEVDRTLKLPLLKTFMEKREREKGGGAADPSK